MRRMLPLVTLALLAHTARACELCAAARVGDGPVFELTTDSIDLAADRPH